MPEPSNPPTSGSREGLDRPGPAPLSPELIAAIRFFAIALVPVIIQTMMTILPSAGHYLRALLRSACIEIPLVIFGAGAGWILAPRIVRAPFRRTLGWQVATATGWALASMAWVVGMTPVVHPNAVPIGSGRFIHFAFGLISLEITCLVLTLVATVSTRWSLRARGYASDAFEA